MSADKTFASPAVFNSPVVPAVPENSPVQSHSSLDGSFRFPFLLSAPPDVLNSPSVTRSRSMDATKRRPSPFPYRSEYKRMKLSSADLPDSASSPTESDMVANSTSHSSAALSPLSPICSPTAAEEGLSPVFSPMQSLNPELDALLATEVDSAASQDNTQVN